VRVQLGSVLLLTMIHRSSWQKETTRQVVAWVVQSRGPGVHPDGTAGENNEQTSGCEANERGQQEKCNTLRCRMTSRCSGIRRAGATRLTWQGNYTKVEAPWWVRAGSSRQMPCCHAPPSPPGHESLFLVTRASRPEQETRPVRRSRREGGKQQLYIDSVDTPACE
jgi:hypothetical protein